MAISTFGQFVRTRREATGTTRERLAVSAKVSVSTIVRLELHDHLPKTPALHRIASQLDLTLDDIANAGAVSSERDEVAA